MTKITLNGEEIDIEMTEWEYEKFTGIISKLTLSEFLTITHRLIKSNYSLPSDLNIIINYNFFQHLQTFLVLV